jgi:shikimate kinase
MLGSKQRKLPFCDSTAPMPFSQADPPSHAELAQRLSGINLYLVGMMGAGKSAVGRPLAAALGYRFLDADTALEQVAGRPIPTVFREDGEQGFRNLETAVLDRIAGFHSLVVATGGGVVTRPVNWGHMQQGVVVWLDAPEALLLARLQADPSPRPLLAEPDPASRLSALLEARRPLYAQADLRLLQGDGPPQTVAQQLLEALPAILKERKPAPQAAVSLVDEAGHCRQSMN